MTADAAEGTAGSDSCSGDTLTILLTKGPLATKTVTWDQVRQEPGVRGYDKAARFSVTDYRVADIYELADILGRLQRNAIAFTIRGSIVAGTNRSDFKRRLHAKGTDPATIEPAARRFVAFDIDAMDCPEHIDPVHDADMLVEHVISKLPPEFEGVTCFWSFTSSHGIKPGIRLRLWFWLDRPLEDWELKTWLDGFPVDHAVFSPAQPIYTAAPIFRGMSDPCPRRCGLWQGEVDEVSPPVIERQTKARARAGGSAAYSPGGGGGYEGYRARIGDHEGGGGFHAPIKSAVAAWVARNGAETDPSWLRSDLEDAIRAAERSKHDDSYIELRVADLDPLIAAVRAMQAAKEAEAGPAVDIDGLMDRLRQPADPLDEALGAGSGAGQGAAGLDPVPPHWPRPKRDGPTAALRLEKIARAFWNAVERRLRAADRRTAIISERKSLVTAEDREQVRPRVMRKSPDLDDADKIEAAIDALINRRISAFASRQVKREFGIVKMAMPRIQIAGAAGLGKSWAVIREYLARPYLWTKHINVYVPTIELAHGFIRDFNEILAKQVGAGALSIGIVPKPWVVPGRSKGNCKRYSVVSKGQLMVPSAYKSFCFDGAFSLCPHNSSCKEAGFLEPYQFRGPCLRVLAHEHIAINQSADIRLPEADVSIVDENCLRAVVKHTNIQPFMLTDPATFQKDNVNHVTVGECIIIGEKVEVALKSGGDVIEALRTMGVTSKDLHFVARVANGKFDQPTLKPHWPDQDHFDTFRKFKENQGRKVASIFSQLGRDMDRGRKNSIGVEFDPKYPIRGALEPTFVPMFLTHRLEPLTLPAGGALLVIDADAVKQRGRRVFGDKLRHMNLPALREGHKTQVTGTAMSKTYLLPPEKYHHQQAQSQKLRDSIAAMVAKKATESVTDRVTGETRTKRVLVITNLPVRQAFTGERTEYEKSVEWQGATLTHFGAYIGANDWKQFDVVYIIGREQPQPQAAERIARAIYADTTEELTFPGRYVVERRGYDIRDGSSGYADVQVHPERLVQDIVELIRERMSAQGLDRLRLMWADGRSVEVVVVCDIPLPGVIVDRLIPLPHLLVGGSRFERAWLERGILPLGGRDLHRLFPALWATEVAAKQALAVEQVNGMNLQLESIGKTIPLKIAYRLVGQRGPLDSTALIDPDRHHDPRDALEAALGPLSKFTIIDPVIGTTAASIGEFAAAGTGVVSISVRAIADALLGAFDASMWGDALIGDFIVVGDDDEPSGGSGGGIAAFAAAASGNLESTRTVTIDGMTVWITPDGRRWFQEPPAAPPAPRRIIRYSGEPALDSPARWLRPGGAAPWSGLTVGGRAVESVGVRRAAA